MVAHRPSVRMVEHALIEALRLVPPGAQPDMAAIRRAIGCTATELRHSVERLRFCGKIQFDRLALSPSMLADDGESGGKAPPPPEAGNTAGAGEKAASAARTVADFGTAASTGADTGASAGPSVGPGAGAILLAEIDAWCARTGTKETDLGALLFRHWGFVALLRKRGSLSPEKERAMRTFLADHPDGLPGIAARAAEAMAGMRAPKPEPEVGAAAAKAPGAAPVQEAVRSEAAARGARRQQAPRSTISTTRHPLDGLSPGELVSTALVETPRDVIAQVNRAWPELWGRVIAIARADAVQPGRALFRAIAAGLDCLEEDNG